MKSKYYLWGFFCMSIVFIIVSWAEWFVYENIETKRYYSLQASIYFVGAVILLAVTRRKKK